MGSAENVCTQTASRLVGRAPVRVGRGAGTVVVGSINDQGGKRRKEVTPSRPLRRQPAPASAWTAVGVRNVRSLAEPGRSLGAGWGWAGLGAVVPGPPRPRQLISRQAASGRPPRRHAAGCTHVGVSPTGRQ